MGVSRLSGLCGLSLECLSTCYRVTLSRSLIRLSSTSLDNSSSSLHNKTSSVPPGEIPPQKNRFLASYIFSVSTFLVSPSPYRSCILPSVQSPAPRSDGSSSTLDLTDGEHPGEGRGGVGTSESRNERSVEVCLSRLEPVTLGTNRDPSVPVCPRDPLYPVWVVFSRHSFRLQRPSPSRVSHRSVQSSSRQ